ncbi:MAG: S1 RNA-binding domain-containing protein [Oscillospiraceae bacterium]|jgi:small subunit ribosomal protein S1|nr:S1 RNA-binding domain-containing protein [Oscillospiraceae bacterium]
MKTQMNEYCPEGYRITTDTNKIYTQSLFGLQKAKLENKILEATAVLCDLEHNLIVDFGFAKGLIPREEAALGIKEGTVRDIAVISRVNHPVCFVVEQAEESDDGGKPVIILSRAKAQELAWKNYINALVPGYITDAKITHLESFGAFADIGCGNIALMPIDCISVSRIEHPRERFTPGDRIRAVIKSVINGRITLTHKELLGTWEENAADFFVGQTVPGIARYVESYGTFIELTPNLSGLSEPSDGILSGQKVSVYIKSIIPEKMKIKLCVIETFEQRPKPQPFKYFIENGIIEQMEYSPQSCAKKIVFKF